MEVHSGGLSFYTGSSQLMIAIGLGISNTTTGCGYKAQPHCLAMAVLAVPVAVISRIPQLLGEATSCQFPMTKSVEKLAGSCKAQVVCKQTGR